MNAASWLESVPAERRRGLLISDGPRIATWVLSIAIAVQAGLIVTDLFGAGKNAKVPPRAAGTPLASLDVAAITRADLYGKAPVMVDPSHAPVSAIPLVLTGIMAGTDPQRGLAILGPSAQATKVYAVGDNVPGGATVHLVYPDRVVIDRGGQLESLMLPRKTASSAPPPSAAALQGNPAIEHVRQMIAAQPGLIGDVIRPQPVMEKGKVTGFRVFPGRNRAAFMSLGLRGGDLVTAINGTPLDDKDRGEEILRTVGSSSEVQVTVIRGGQQQDLTLNIAQIEAQAEGLANAGPNAGVPPVGVPQQAATTVEPPVPPGPPPGTPAAAGESDN
jgi:general secretion pathway protein C